jgi:hypothetical protein
MIEAFPRYSQSHALRGNAYLTHARHFAGFSLIHNVLEFSENFSLLFGIVVNRFPAEV